MEDREQYGTPAADIGKLSMALVKAQAGLTNPIKNKTVTVRTKEKGTYGYSYADLGSILEHVRPVLAKHGLAVIQRITTTPEAVTLVTELIHESGQLLSSFQPLPKGCAAQEFGSYLTYARRYSVSALLGIAAEDDDDGLAGNNTKATGSSEETARDELMERVCNDSVSNIGLVRWCQAEGLVDDEARIADDLPIEVVKTVLERWPDVVKAVRENAKKPPTSKSTMVKPVDDAKADDTPVAKDNPKPKVTAKQAKAEKSEAPAAGSGSVNDQLELMPPKLRKLMIKDGITPAMLKAVYVSRGHLPDTVEPTDLPEDYVDQICEPSTWPKLVAAAAAS